MRSVGDLDDREIEVVMARAAGLVSGDGPPPRDGMLGLVFLEESLRTRIGFAVAAARLGWRSVEVAERRDGPTTSPELLADTLRTIAGYVDVLVVRPAEPLTATATSDLPAALLNCGDRGAAAEHPSQALIDLFAIEQLRGPIADQHVVVCGDPGMRSVRSLLALLARRPPRRLSLVCAPTHRDDLQLPEPLDGVVELRDLAALEDVDVLYAAGIPHDSLPLDVRERLLIGRQTLAALPSHGVVLSPLPIIDEVDAEVRGDPRVRVFAQSDLALYVRMALLELLGG